MAPLYIHNAVLRWTTEPMLWWKISFSAAPVMDPITRPRVCAPTEPNRPSEPLWRAVPQHLNQIDFADLNYEDTDIMHKVIYSSEEFE